VVKHSDVSHRGAEVNAYFVVLICIKVSIGGALAANNPSDRDEFLAKAAPAKLKTPVFSVTSVAKFLSHQPTKSGKDPVFLPPYPYAFLSDYPATANARH
jgi:hypothetical protein